MTNIPLCPICSSPAHEVRGQLLWYISCSSGSCPVSPSYSVMPGYDRELYLGWQGVCLYLSGPVTVEVDLT